MEQAELPQAMPLIEIDGELQISVFLSVSVVNIELEKSPISRVMMEFCLSETVVLRFSEDQKPLC